MADDVLVLVHDESDTDMLVATPLPLAGRDQDRTVAWGSVNPLDGREALDLMERQVSEFGAKAFTLRDVHHDPRMAFPIFEKAQELGVNLIGVNKGVSFDSAAAGFPDINFVIHQVGPPLLDETCWRLIRYPNQYVSLAATITLLVRAPRTFAEIFGKLLFWCGEDKIVYGSEGHPRRALRAFMDFQLPRDLCDGHGYPQLTETAKRKILGENLSRLHGMTLVDAAPRPRP